MRGIWLIIIIVAICVLAGLLLFLFLFRGQSMTVESPASEENLGGTLSLSTDRDSSEINPAVGVTDISPEEIAARGTIVDINEDEASARLQILQRVIDSAVISPTLSAEEAHIQYYDVYDEEIRTTNLVGDDQQTLDFPLHIVGKIIWANDKNSYVYESPGEGTFFAGLDGEEDVALGDLVKSPVFVGPDNVLAYHFADLAHDNSTVSIGNPAQGLQDYLVLARLRGNVIVKNIPGTEKIAYYLSPNVNRQAAIYTVNLEGSQTEIISSKSYAMDAKWSPDGSKMVYTKLGDNGRPQLYLADGNGQNSYPLTYSTYVEKIVFSQTANKMYMAVPSELPRIADFYGKGVKTTDRIFEVDLESGEAWELYDLVATAGGFGAFNLFLSSEEKLLYFTDDTDSNLYVFNIAKFYRELAEAE
ncbi:TolB family protein [Patescibacteria group bacterium]